jgi:signal transduction histidine kinase/ligand-binding sensor domain-containing protein/ActR/RegA family two-component response regulator
LAVATSPSALASDWTDIGRLPLRTFTDRDGLPQNAITGIVFAADGALWIGTKDGAARYNGRTWTSVPMPPGCTSAWVNALARGSDGSLWFGTRGGGLARLKDGAWRVFTKSDGLPNDEILALVESATLDAEPVMVAGTAEGPARFDGARFQAMELPKGLPTTRVTALFESRSEGVGAGLWVGLRDGIANLDSGKWTAYDLPAFGLPSNNPVRAFAISSALDGKDRVFAVVTHPGLLQLEDDRWVPKAVGRTPLGMGQALLTTRDRDGRESLWIGGQQRLVHIRGGEIRILGPEAGFPEEGFWSLAETPADAGESALWVGMAGAGLVRLQRQGWTSFGSPRWLSNASVYSLLETLESDGRSVIWVGTNRGGLVRMHPDGTTVYEGRNKAGSDTVLSLLETRSKSGRTIWSGTTSGLGEFRNGAWKRVDLGDWTGATVNALLASPRGNGEPAIYVGVGEGVGLLENGRFTKLNEAIGLPDTRVNTLLETVGTDGRRTLWVGTERGLARREPDKTVLYTTRDGLPAEAILSLVEVEESGRRRLWIGTRGGAARMDLSGEATTSDRFTLFTSRGAPALPNDTIYQVRNDRHGRIYLFTNKGVARLTPRKPTPEDSSEYDLYTYLQADGLPSAECNTGASMVDSKGRIWAGTINGVAVIDPDDTFTARSKPLRIERALLSRNGAPLPEGAALAHDEGNLTFEYALMNLFRDEDSRYRTQLEGLDTEPSPWTADAKKEYTSLPEGVYAFNVWARDVSGAISGPARFAFSVRAAPWRTWWAFLLYAAFAAGAISLGMRYRLASVRRRNEDLERLISARTVELGDAVERLKVSEQAALQAKDAALEASHAKSTFLANMSHELRTPLNAVIGFAQVLDRRAALKGEDRESLGIIQKSGEHLLSLINDVLSLAKIEAGGMALALKPFDLRALIGSVQSIISVRAEAKGLTLAFDTDPGLPRVVLGDEAKLRQVLINLLGNAVKFTSAGHVALTVTMVAERIRFEVEDTGAGIHPSEVPHLFTAFLQTESGRSSREGTGLGLAISRQIVTLMGGDIEVVSRVGQGSVFRFEIALPATDAAIEETAGRVTRLAPGQSLPRILIVDDTEQNRRLLNQLLVAVGFEVREASGGRQAIEIAEAWKPAVIFMDARMTGIDGREATRRIREREAAESGARAAIVALSAGVFEHEREEMLASGADDFVAKPFRIEAILARIARFTGVKYLYETDPSAAPAPASGSILTVARLASIQGSKRARLHEALADGDSKGAREAADDVAVDDQELGRALAAEVQAFRFDELLSLLEKADRANS